MSENFQEEDQRSTRNPRNEQRSELQRKQTSSPQRNEHYLSFFLIATLGFALHTGAILITRYGLASGQVSELNPIFYKIGPDNFALFGFVIMIVYYGGLWILNMSLRMKLFLAAVLTIVTAFDFFHDIFTVSNLLIMIRLLLHGL